MGHIRNMYNFAFCMFVGLWSLLYNKQVHAVSLCINTHILYLHLVYIRNGINNVMFGLEACTSGDNLFLKLLWSFSIKFHDTDIYSLILRMHARTHTKKKYFSRQYATNKTVWTFYFVHIANFPLFKKKGQFWLN